MHDLRGIIEKERTDEIRADLAVISNKLVLPLFMVFWICDLLYMPAQKWTFLFLRAGVLPINYILGFSIPRLRGYRDHQRLAIVYMAAISMPLSIMIWLSGNWASPYYAGLNLVAIGSLAFIPWSPKYFAICVLVIFGPYYALCLTLPGASAQLFEVLVNSFFVVSTITITAVIRIAAEQMRLKEVRSRLRLHDEIERRDRIIVEKTEEGLKLAALGRQFSPQVVEAIKTGQIDLRPGVHRSNICAVFIDIVNSTERVARIDKDKVNRALTMFMEDSVKTLLKYDITIDKFLGDGILAFCNDPVHYEDCVDRVVRASLEIRQKIHSRRDEYVDVWMAEMQLRFGIAFGFANVGFYGNEKYYKSYTAIGPVVNMASRLCSSAEPSQILVSSDVVNALKGGGYEIGPLGARTLKGFEGDMIKVFEINSIQHDSKMLDELDCPKCAGGLFYLDSDSDGIFVMKCRSCGHIQRESLMSGATAPVPIAKAG